MMSLGCAFANAVDFNQILSPKTIKLKMLLKTARASIESLIKYSL